MRRVRLSLVMVLLVSMLGLGTQVSADTWDYVYGEDPTNANNVSAFLDVKVDPLGGIFLTGYFYGSYEGLSSGGNYSYFVQHRNVSGSVDWTVQYESLSSNLSPLRFFETTVDGQGTLYIQSFFRNGSGPQDPYQTTPGSRLNSRWYSISRSGTVSDDPSNSTGAGSPCIRGVGTPEGGVVRYCDESALPFGSNGIRLKKSDSAFVESWNIDAQPYIGTVCSNYEQGNSTTSACELLINGSGNSVWLIDGLNVQNANLNQTLLPQDLRVAMGMTRIDTVTGARITSIKHYGILPRSAVSVGSRSVWMWVKTLDTSACYLGSCQDDYTPNASFDATTGALNGYFENKFGRAPRFLNFLFTTETAQWLVDNDFIDYNPSTDPRASYSPDYCAVTAFVYNSASWVGAGRQQFMGTYQPCPNGSYWATEIFNDGRRLVLISNDQLAVFEIVESSTGIPSIGQMLRHERFSSNVQSFDADEQGNIYVVGSTFSTTVIAAESPSLEPQSSLAATRAFINRNPGGRIGLTVLPRTPLTFKVTGSNGVPTSGVGAVSMNVTVVSPGGEGYITVYPCGTRPEASNLNYVVSQTVPNAVIAPVSADGEVCFYTYAETHLLADINGYFPAGQGFVAVTPVRVADTRAASGQGARTVPKVKIGGPTELRFQATGITSVTPASGVGAVSMNVTVTNAVTDDFGGYLTVYPCGTRPDASSLNFRTGQTVPNSVIAPVSATGEVCIYGYGTADVIVDINGYFPAGQGFVAVTPARVADTRAASVQGLRVVNKTRIGGDTELRVKVTDLAGIVPATGVGAVSMNVTATNNTTDNFGGYLTVYPCGSRPEASNVNFSNNQTVPNAVISPVSANGEICIWARGTTDVIVDINGYFPTGQGFVALTPVRAFDTR